MELWLLDNHHETVAGSDSKLAKPHEKNERLKRNEPAALTALLQPYPAERMAMWPV